jgi:hypothetical protein
MIASNTTPTAAAYSASSTTTETTPRRVPVRPSIADCSIDMSSAAATRAALAAGPRVRFAFGKGTPPFLRGKRRFE